MVISESELARRSDLVELGDSGWGQLVGWMAGVSRMVRVVDRQQHMTRITYQATGQTFERPRSEEEQTEVEELVNARLAEADVPPRPAGYVWYLMRPPSVASDTEFWSRINDAQLPAALPEHILLREIAEELYSSD